MSDKLLHIHYLFLTYLLSFIHAICFSCSFVALIVYSQVIQQRQHSLQNSWKSFPPSNWSSLSDPNLASLPVFEVCTLLLQDPIKGPHPPVLLCPSPSPLRPPSYSALPCNFTHRILSSQAEETPVCAPFPGPGWPSQLFSTLHH